MIISVDDVDHDNDFLQRCQARILAVNEVMQKVKLHTGIVRSAKAGISWNITAIVERGNSEAGDDVEIKRSAEDANEEVLKAMASLLLTREQQALSKVIFFWLVMVRGLHH